MDQWWDPWHDECGVALSDGTSVSDKDHARFSRKIVSAR
jgi:hypothetical protein